MQEAYEDAIAQNLTYIHRYGTQTYTKIIRQLERAEIRLTAQIAADLEGLSADEIELFKRQSYKSQRLIALRESIRELAKAYRTITMAEVRGDGKELFLAQAEFHESLITSGVEISAAAATVTPSQAYVAAVAQPFNGSVLKQFGRNMESGVRRRVDESLRTSFVNSEDLNTAIRGIRGTKALNYKDGVLDISRRGADLLARTHFTHLANRAALHTFKMLDIKRIRYVAVLDSRVTILCASLDSSEWPIESDAIRIPPQHPRCRSQLVSVLDDYEPKGFRPFVKDKRPVSQIPKSERKDKIGRVRQDTSYAKWFGRQDAAYQRDWLGSTRYNLYKSGDFPLKKFIDFRGGLARNFTIDELRLKHKSIFDRLGL